MIFVKKYVFFVLKVLKVRLELMNARMLVLNNSDKEQFKESDFITKFDIHFQKVYERFDILMDGEEIVE